MVLPGVAVAVLLGTGRALMPNTRTVCVKVSPERLAVLRAQAQAQGMTLSGFLRGVVCAALELKEKERGRWGDKGRGR